MIDGNAVTTMRTGAAGGLGISLLARQDSRSVCVFGTGVQARIQLEYALGLLPSIAEVRYVTASGQPDPGFESAFAGRCHMSHAVECNAAVAASDIVITATPGRAALFDPEAVRPGTHISCVGADTRGKRELPEGLLARVRLFVDDRIQASQIGETQWAPETPCAEIGDLLTEKVVFSRDQDDITVFDLTGLALQDLTVARLLHRRATAARVGTSLAWPW
jgi:ornithine cyclodeaminase